MSRLGELERAWAKHSSDLLSGKTNVFNNELCLELLEARRRMNFQPLGNRVLVRRLPAQPGVIDLSACDEKAGGGMVLVEGEILAVGPGVFNEDFQEFIPTTVKPGQKVIFNARWNDFAHSELIGSDSDLKGPLERPMPQWQYAGGQRDLHLITEGDIAGILHG